MEDVLDTLLRTAREMLKPGGRLVFFLPTVTAECVYHAAFFARPATGLAQVHRRRPANAAGPPTRRQLAAVLQQVDETRERNLAERCTRRTTLRSQLITMVRTGDDLEPAASTTDANGVKHVPAHVNFQCVPTSAPPGLALSPRPIARSTSPASTRRASRLRRAAVVYTLDRDRRKREVHFARGP
jgi:hypothetical protein